jgi:uncharacterized membrane-anchored protein YhcB (DUF1043 family)
MFFLKSARFFQKIGNPYQYRNKHCTLTFSRSLFFDKKKSKSAAKVEEDIHSKNRRENLKTYSRQQKKPGKIS